MIKTQAEAEQVKDLAQEVADLTSQIEKLKKTQEGVDQSTNKRISQVGREVAKITVEANKLLEEFAQEARKQADLAKAELNEAIKAKKRRLDTLGQLISSMTEKLEYDPNTGAYLSPRNPTR